MTNKTLSEWLDYQQQVHPDDIALGLERVAHVWQRMDSPRAPLTLTVAGTNGKGSTVAYLTSMLDALGYKVGTYTSPHIERYNERVALNGQPVSDEALCQAFATIEKARGDIPLTYYEYGTLAALTVFASVQVDVMVLEVGLGGRLDATNIVDADGVAITSIGLDHCEWLGPDRDSIGREKAGVARPHRPAVVGDVEPPRGLLEALGEHAAEVLIYGRDFKLEKSLDGTYWHDRDGSVLKLPKLKMLAPCQERNAATALTLLYQMKGRIRWQEDKIRDGLRTAIVPGRLQSLGVHPSRFVDVAHNPQSAQQLAMWLDGCPHTGKVHAVFSALADKDIEGVITSLGTRIDQWWIAGLDKVSPRGASVEVVQETLAAGLPQAVTSSCTSLTDAWDQALDSAEDDDILIAFGSFFVVSAILEHVS